MSGCVDVREERNSGEVFVCVRGDGWDEIGVLMDC